MSRKYTIDEIRRKNQRETTIANIFMVFVFLLMVAIFVGLRLWIAGPECFFAEDVGVCQAIRSVGGQ